MVFGEWRFLVWREIQIRKKFWTAWSSKSWTCFGSSELGKSFFKSVWEPDLRVLSKSKMASLVFFIVSTQIKKVNNSHWAMYFWPRVFFVLCYFIYFIINFKGKVLLSDFTQRCKTEIILLFQSNARKDSIFHLLFW